MNSVFTSKCCKPETVQQKSGAEKNGKNSFIPTKPGLQKLKLEKICENRSEYSKGRKQIYLERFKELGLSLEKSMLLVGEIKYLVFPRVVLFTSVVPFKQHILSLSSDPIWNTLYVILVISDLIKAYMQRRNTLPLPTPDVFAFFPSMSTILWFSPSIPKNTNMKII